MDLPQAIYIRADIPELKMFMCVTGLPPDLSLICKARHGGADYIMALSRFPTHDSIATYCTMPLVCRKSCHEAQAPFSQF